MANINNHFTWTVTSPLIVFALALMIFLPILAPKSANAADPIFTVEDIVADATAENAIAASEKAFQEAQVMAFEELTARILPESALATTQTPAVNIISTMIKDFELKNEKLSDVRYVGTYTFRFKDRDVRRYFAQRGATISDVSSKTLLILPFLNRDSRTTIWAPGNAWMQAWNRVPNLGGVVPLEVPLGDIDDVRDISDSSAYTYDPGRLTGMLTRYGAEEAVITIASPDDALQQIFDPLAVARGSITIEVFRTDRGAPELVDQLMINADGVLTRDALYDRGVTMVRSALQKNWKTKTAVAPSPKSRITRVVVPIQSLADWVKIRTELGLISSLNGITLKSLTPRQANLEIAYNGDPERFALTLAQAGLEIEQGTASDGSAINILTSSRSTSGRAPMRF